jgi:hypothetical protein
LPERAPAEGERHGDGFAVATALHALTLGAMVEDAESGLAYADRALALPYEGPQLTDLRLIMFSNKVSGVVALDRLPEAKLALPEGLAMAERTSAQRFLAGIVHFFGSGTLYFLCSAHRRCRVGFT